MRIRIPIPKRVLEAYDRWGDWANVPAFEICNFQVLRIDIMIACNFLICIGWYGYTSGLMGALTGGTMFVFLLICALWIWRK